MADDVSQDEALFTTVRPEALALANPFGDAECVRVDLLRPVNVSQLADEITAEIGQGVQISMVNARPGTPVSADNPAGLFIRPVIDEDVLTEVITKHRPDDAYGLGIRHKERLDLVEKLESGEDLTKEELIRALKIALVNR